MNEATRRLTEERKFVGDLDGEPPKSPLEGIIYGTAASDSMTGTPFEDRLVGGAGDDVLTGLASDDQLAGGDGDDHLEGGDGADFLDGGSGFDAASFTSASAAVVIDLDDPSRNAGEAAGDEFLSIERFILSQFDDTFVGGSGSHKIDGGAGFDTVSFEGALTSIVVDLADPSNNAGEAAGDEMVSIENFILSGFDDVFVDGDGDASVSGGNGHDIFLAHAGDDRFRGEAGDDTFRFAADFGHDSIADFTAGAGSEDAIAFGSLFDDFDDLLSAATQSGLDTVITYDADNTITLENVALASLHSDDFRFM